ncbi:hypothetical protein [Nakamurella sp.]|uniref:hypothetical protein n=1 Tax=Nakamurella sp. TaxID=1869182 RepID=UPI003B3AFE1E
MSAAPVSSPDHERDRHYTANVITSLREDYRLRADEAERAVSLFLRRKAGWSTPDQAAFEAYQWWTPTVEPSVVLAREAEQRAHATGTTISAGPGHGATPAADPTFGFDPQTTSETFADFESALSMIRTQGDTDGFTADHLALARQLRDLLDQSPVWDTITPDTTIQDHVAFRRSNPPCNRRPCDPTTTGTTSSPSTPPSPAAPSPSCAHPEPPAQPATSSSPPSPTTRAPWKAPTTPRWA